jgi:hypothetical protein
MNRSERGKNGVLIAAVSVVLGTVVVGLGASLLRQGGSGPTAVQVAAERAVPTPTAPSWEPEMPPPAVPESDAAATRLAAHPGDRFAYDLDARWEARLEHHAATPSTEVQWTMRGEIPPRVRTDLEGTLGVVVLAREDDGAYLVGFSVTEPKLILRTGGRSQTVTTVALDRPAVARLSDDGRVLGYVFDPDVAPETRSLLVAVFSLSHQFVLRDAAEPWTVAGLQDDVGSFTGRFEWQPSSRFVAIGAREVLRRTVVAYAPSAGQQIERSAADAAFTAGWLAAADVREVRRASIADVLTAQTSVHLRLQRARRTTVPVDPAEVPPTGTRWRLRFPPAAAAEGPETPSTPKADEPSLGDPLERLDGLLAQLDDLVEGSRLDQYEAFEAWRDIADLVRRAPGAVLPELMAMIRDGRLDPAAVNWTVSAIGKAGDEGSAEAVAALAGLIADPAAADASRLAALLSAHQIGSRVPPELIEAVTDVLLTAGADEDGSTLVNAAGLLAGTLAGRDAQAAEDLSMTEAALDLVQKIVFARREPEVYFDALLNSGRSDLIERALGYTDHADETVRRAAIDALKGLPGDPRALETVVDLLADEPSPLVRGAAVESLAVLEPTPEGAPVLLELSLHDPDRGVRARAVGALGEHATRGLVEAHDALVRASTEGSAEVRELALGLLDDLSISASAGSAPDDVAAREGNG